MSLQQLHPSRPRRCDSCLRHFRLGKRSLRTVMASSSPSCTKALVPFERRRLRLYRADRSRMHTELSRQLRHAATLLCALMPRTCSRCLMLSPRQRDTWQCVLFPVATIEPSVLIFPRNVLPVRRTRWRNDCAYFMLISCGIRLLFCELSKAMRKLVEKPRQLSGGFPRRTKHLQQAEERLHLNIKYRSEEGALRACGQGASILPVSFYAVLKHRVLCAHSLQGATMP